MKSREILSWFKLMNIKISDCMEILNKECGINKNKLAPYEYELRLLVVDNEDFDRCFNDNKVAFSHPMKNSFVQFQQQNAKLFNEIIVLINKS